MPDHEYIDSDPGTAPFYTADEPSPDDWREPEAEGVSTVEAGDDPDEERDAEPKPRRRFRVGNIFTGGFLSDDKFTYRLPVLLYIVALMLLYIANGYHMQGKHNRIDKLTEQLKELKTVAVTASAVRMTMTRQSEIEKLLVKFRIPLAYDDVPPRVIVSRNTDSLE